MAEHPKVFAVTFTMSELRQVISALTVSLGDPKLIDRLLKILSSLNQNDPRH